MNLRNVNINKINHLPTAVDYNRLVDIVNVLGKISLGPNMVGSISNNGICLDAKQTQASTTIAEAQRPFHLVLNGNTATISNIIYRRGTVTLFTLDNEAPLVLSHTITTPTETILYTKINVETGEVTIGDSNDPGTAYDNYESEDEFTRIPLYKLTEISPEIYRVSIDLRDLGLSLFQ